MRQVMVDIKENIRYMNAPSNETEKKAKIEGYLQAIEDVKEILDSLKYYTDKRSKFIQKLNTDISKLMEDKSYGY